MIDVDIFIIISHFSNNIPKYVQNMCNIVKISPKLIKTNIILKQVDLYNRTMNKLIVSFY